MALLAIALAMGAEMFGFGRKRARDVATRIGRTMVIVRDACQGSDLQALENVMQGHGYTSIGVDASNHGPIAGWIEGSSETADMVHFVSSSPDPNGRIAFQVTAEGRGSLAGLILIGGIGDIHVEVSDTLKATKEVGVDTFAVQKELLAFPGFSSMDQLLASLRAR